MKKRAKNTGEGGATTLIYKDDQPSVVSVSTFNLKVLAGPGKGDSVTSGEDGVLVGTSPGCGLVMRDDTVSRSHCSFEACEEGFRLRDHGSTNGTWIGTTRVYEALLTETTDLVIGSTRVRFSQGAQKVEVPLSARSNYGDMFGESAGMRDVFARMERVSPTDVTVLLEGESGTGKELAARAIHDSSVRADGPYEVFDCTAVAPNVIESELFGHERGAFTGATGQYLGVFERAHGGTLFIDEVGDLRSDLQPKLLRALENGEIRRVGGSQVVEVNVRVVAATNRDLMVDVNSGGFRLDLFFRLAGVRISLPSLRSRPDDIPLLVRRFADEFVNRHGLSSVTGDLSSETMKMLRAHPWPGNVRELRNFVEQSLVLAEMAELPATSVEGSHPLDEQSVRTDLPYKEARELLLDRFCRAYFFELLEKNRYNVTRMAKEAGIDRVYAQRMIKKYGLK